MGEIARRDSLTLNKTKYLKQAEHYEDTLYNPMPISNCYKQPWKALGAWFLGPRAENKEVFNRLITQIIGWYSECREGQNLNETSYIDETVKASREYKSEIQDTENQLKIMFNELKGSVPFFSSKYQGHMNWENTMPSILGYFSGMLWNPNNVDSTVSPVTTKYEIDVGQHLCQLMNFENTSKISPWAHITSCGSIANTEAMWAARNLKFHPLAVHAVVTGNNAGELAKGANTPVYLPELDARIPLNQCTKWQLLNLDVDTACSISDDVCRYCGLTDNMLLNEKLENESVINIGLVEFILKHGISKLPVICAPSTSHYSWPKSATALGMGVQSVLSVKIDRNARQSVKDLDDKLNSCLGEKRAVLMVVVVIGTTNEGAIDPLQDIVNLRDRYRGKGLNFSIHVDAAWGGYFQTMLRPSACGKRSVYVASDEGYVAALPLSRYSITQLQAMKYADTVTIDPHKSGLCLYPAGALCYRNGTMKGFITLKAPEVFHGDTDISVGVFGLEGSKPGAAAAGVMLSHRVIGLDQMGYGRILGQCQLGAKLFYCMWMTVAQDYDDFVCVNFVDLPQLPKDLPQTEKEHKEFIRTRILERDNRELAIDYHAIKYLSIIGPDCLVNSFVVNIAGNSVNLEALNQLQKDIFNETNVTVGQPAKRVPLFLTTSVINPDTYGEAAEQLKNRLNITVNGDVNFLRNTCMNPFQCSDKVTETGKHFRNIVMNCIGGLEVGGFGDPAVYHTFVVCGRMNKYGKIFLDYIPSFTSAGKQYHVILKMTCVTDTDRDFFRTAQKFSQSTFFVKTKTPLRMKSFLRSSKSCIMEVFQEKPSGNKLFDIDMTVDEVFRYNHLESLQASKYIEYPEQQIYFLYGDTKQAFISHVPSKSPDFHQVIELDEVPHSVTTEMLDFGVIINISKVPGRPLKIRGSISDPLHHNSYTVSYMGMQKTPCQTSISFARKNAKLWFDGNI